MQWEYFTLNWNLLYLEPKLTYSLIWLSLKKVKESWPTYWDSLFAYLGKLQILFFYVLNVCLLITGVRSSPHDFLILWLLLDWVTVTEGQTSKCHLTRSFIHFHFCHSFYVEMWPGFISLEFFLNTNHSCELMWATNVCFHFTVALIPITQTAEELSSCLLLKVPKEIFPIL